MLVASRGFGQDTNNNGIPDSWEIQYLGNLNNAASADPGGVGRTILQSYQQGLNPWPAPTVASGLQAWYRADQGVIADSSNNVSQWTDVSGSGFHVFQTADSGKEPLLVSGAMNGNPAVQFSPQQVLTTPQVENLEAGGIDVTVITVVVPSASQGYGSTIFSWGTDGNVPFGISSNTANSYLMYWAGGDGTTYSTLPLVATSGQAQVISEVKSGTSSLAYLNGATVGMGTVAASMAATNATLAMGNAAYPYYGFTGQVAEVLVYNRALSTSERQSIEAALTAKYINPDSNGNGIPDSWEMQYLGNLSYGANADPGGVGRTILQSYQQGLSPWPAPAVVSGLQAWYRADKGVVADSSNNVTQWTDLSGSGFHVYQTAYPSKEPQLVSGAMNGYPAVQFAPQQVLMTPVLENLEAGGSDITVITVLAPSATQGYAATIFSWGTDGNVPYGLSSNATNSYLLYWAGGDGNTAQTTPLSATAGQVQVISEEKGGTSASSYLNGVLVGSKTVNGTIAAANFPLAMGNSSYPYYGFTGQIAEVLVYNRALSTEERQSVEATLTSKYLNPDSNGNGIPDTWEMKYLGNLSYGANADPGGVGRTLLQSYQQGLSPWPTATVPSGLQAWYRADKGVVADVNNNVSQWTDVSGSGYHVFQTVDPTKEPRLVAGAMNGNPAVQFTPQQVLTTPVVENLEGGGTDVTVIAVVTPNASQGYASTIFSWGTDGNVAYGLSSNATNSYLLYWDGGDGNTTQTPALSATAGQVQVISEEKGGTTATSYLNGTLVGSSSVNATIAATNFPLAMGNSTYPYYGFTGQVAEVLVYNRALSTAERQSVEAALTAKYVNTDTNGNGIPDSWEMQYLGNLSYGASADPGGVGRTLLQSYQQGLSPWPSPVVTGGLRAWYRADEGVVADSNNNVSQWTDLSGNGFHVFQTVDPTKEPPLIPAELNGHPVVQFTPQQVLTTPVSENLEAGGSDITVIAVIAASPFQGYMSTVFSWGTDGNVPYGLSSNGTNSYLLYWAGGDSNTAQTPPLSATFGQVEVISEEKAGTTASAFLNGAMVGSRAVNGTMAATTSPLAMGNSTYPYYGFTGQVAELLVYNRALSTSERRSVEAALTARYVYFDTNNNGIPDTWEMQYLGNLNYDANTDPGGVGRTILQSYQQGLSPWPAPTVASGLQAWYRADEGIIADSSNNVSQWTDLSGNGFHVFQTVDPTREPLLVGGALNNNPVVQFTPQQMLTTPILENLEAGGNDMTVIAVVAPSASQGYASTIFSWGTDGNVAYGLSSNANNSYLLYWPGGDGNTWSSPPVSATAGQAQLISEVKGGTTVCSYLNGVSAGSSTVVGSMAATSFPLAMGNSTYPYYGFTGQVAEVLVFNRALSTAERQGVEAVLTSKYFGVNPNAPVLTSATTATGTVGSTFGYQTTATNSPTTFAAIGLPPGLVISSTAGSISGIPTTAGTYPVTLTLANASGPNTATLTITVFPNSPVVSGIALWLKSDTGVVTGSSGNVSIWRDQSGAGNDAFLATGATSPLLVTNQNNGLPVVRFDGPNALSLPYNMMQNAQSGEIIAVVNIASDPNDQNTLWNFGNGLGTYYYNTDHYDDFGNSDDGHADVESLAQINQYYVYDTSTDTNGTTIYRYNGMPLWTRNGLGVGFLTGPDIGGPGAGNFFGDISEILIFNRVLLPEEQAQIYNYLSSRYSFPGITTAVEAPAITSWNFWTGTVGQPFTFQVTASNNPTSFSASGIPAGLTMDSAGLISGIPTVDGLSVITVSASNGAGQGSSPFFLTISSQSSQPPVITSSETAAGQVGQAFSYQVAANYSPTSYSAAGLPPGLSIDGNGLISGTLPTTPGMATVILTASNSAGSGSEALDIITASNLIYSTGFEPNDGFTINPLGGQNGWNVVQGAAEISTQDPNSGIQSLQLDSGDMPAVAIQTFPSTPGESIEYCDFYALPAAETDINASSVYTVEGAQFGFQQVNGQGVLEAYYGDGNGGGTWTPTTFTIPIGAGNQSTIWVRLTARFDFGAQTWDLYANGAMLAANIPFTSSSSTYLSTLQIQGDAGVATYIDDLYVGDANPLFADVNNDGISDAWEAQYGLSLTTNDRSGDPSGGGVTNVQKYIQGTSPQDFYNGIEPAATQVVTSSPGEGAPGPNNDLALFVQRPDGTPWVNAPVTFQVTSGIRQFSLVQGQGPYVSTLIVNTDSTGVARVYLQPQPSQ